MALQKYVFAYGRGTQSFEYDDADVLSPYSKTSKGTCSTCSSTPSGSRRSARL